MTCVCLHVAIYQIPFLTGLDGSGCLLTGLGDACFGFSTFLGVKVGSTLGAGFSTETIIAV